MNVTFYHPLENASAFQSTLISERLCQTKCVGANSASFPRQNAGTVRFLWFLSNTLGHTFMENGDRAAPQIGKIRIYL